MSLPGSGGVVAAVRSTARSAGELLRRRPIRAIGMKSEVSVGERARRLPTTEPLGEHDVVVRLHRQVTATLKVKVIAAA